MSFHGNPVWYELTTSDLTLAESFYGPLLDWSFSDSGMPQMTYHLAQNDGDMVAGLMSEPEATGSSKNATWLVYFAVDSCDETAAAIKEAGGSIVQPPADIPGTGRFAVATDPQGAYFGILQPNMLGMSAADIARAKAGEGAFNQKKPGHGNWHELMTTDPEGAYHFYVSLFGWTKGQTMDMGEMGNYQLIRRGSVDIGAIMGLGNSPIPAWLPYFGVGKSVGQVAASINSSGGSVRHGPMEVPGPAYIAIAQDPNGGWFAVVGTQA